MASLNEIASVKNVQLTIDEPIKQSITINTAPITLRQRLADKLLHYRTMNPSVTNNGIVQLHNNYNSTSDTERYVYTPDMLRIRMFELLIQLFICYNTISITIRMTVGYDYITTQYTWVNGLDLLADILYVCNIVLKTRLAYESHGAWITNKQHIWHRYKQTYELYYDIITLTLLIDWILFAVSLPFISLCVRLGRLLQLRYPRRYINRLDGTPGINILYVRLLKLFVYFFFLSHFIGIFWWCIALPDSFSNDNTGWLPTKTIYAMQVPSRYIHSLYWAIGTMTGRYEEGIPQSAGQLVYSIFTFLLGTLFIAYLIGNIAFAVDSVNESWRDLQRRVDYVIQFLRQNNVPSGIHDKVINYYLHSFKANSGFDDKSLLSSLPTTLRTDVLYYLTNCTLENEHLFSGLSSEFITSLVKHLESKLVVPGEYLCREHDTADEMYFIREGHVEISKYDTTSKCEKILSKLKSGDAFGEYGLVLGGQRTASARAVSYTDLWVLKRTGLNECLQFHSNVANELKSRISEQSRKDTLKEQHMHLMKQVNINVDDTGAVMNTFSTTTKQQHPLSLTQQHTIKINQLADNTKVVAVTLYHTVINFFVVSYHWVVHSGVIDANSHLWQFWCYLRFVITLYNAVGIPLRIGFAFSYNNISILCIDYVTDALLWFNILLQYRRTHATADLLIQQHDYRISVVQDHTPVPNQSLHTRNHSALPMLREEDDSELRAYRAMEKSDYIHGLMIVDIVSIIPLDLIMLGIGMNPLLRLNRILRLVSDSNVFSSINLARAGMSYAMVELFRLCSMVLLLCHFTSCFYWCFPEYFEGYCDPVDAADNWLPSTQYQSASTITQYLRAMWTIVVFISGLGKKPVPVTDGQVLFSMLLVLQGIFIVAWAIGEVATLTQNLSRLQASQSHLLWKTDKWMQFRNLPDTLKQRILAYLAHKWSATHGIDAVHALHNLPPKLKQDIKLHTIESTIRNVPIFNIQQQMDSSFLRALSDKMNYISLPSYEYVYKRGEIADIMYIVETGSVGIVIDDDSQPVKILGSGAIFGEMAMFQSHVRNASIRTLQPTFMLSLSKKEYNKLSSAYPMFVDQLQKVAQTREKELQSLLLNIRSRSDINIVNTGTIDQSPTIVFSSINVTSPTGSRIAAMELPATVRSRRKTLRQSKEFLADHHNSNTAELIQLRQQVKLLQDQLDSALNTISNSISAQSPDTIIVVNGAESSAVSANQPTTPTSADTTRRIISHQARKPILIHSTTNSNNKASVTTAAPLSSPPSVSMVASITTLVTGNSNTADSSTAKMI